MSLDFEKLNLYISQKEVEWQYFPYPHAIIDDFLPEDIFNSISSIELSSRDDLRRSNTYWS